MYYKGITSVVVLPKVNNGRLTLETGVPVSTTDQSNKTSLFFETYDGDDIALFDGENWDYFSIGSGISIDNSGLSVDANYDVFIYDSTGLTLELVAWTDDTNRATALVRQDGVLAKTGETNKRYLGTIRTVDDAATAKFEDSKQKRFVINYQNRILWSDFTEETADSWVEDGNGTWSALNGGSSVFKWETLIPISGEYVLEGFVSVHPSLASGTGYALAIDLDWTSGDPTRGYGNWGRTNANVTLNQHVRSEVRIIPPIGYHFLQAVETSLSATSFSVFGDNAGSGQLSTGMGASGWR